MLIENYLSPFHTVRLPLPSLLKQEMLKINYETGTATKLNPEL